MKVWLIWDGRDYYGPDPGDAVFDRDNREHVPRPWVFASQDEATAELAFRRERYGEDEVGLYVESYEVSGSRLEGE